MSCHRRNSQTFIEPDTSLQYLQDTGTGTIHETTKSSPQHYTLFLQYAV